LKQKELFNFANPGTRLQKKQVQQALKEMVSTQDFNIFWKTLAAPRTGSFRSNKESPTTAKTTEESGRELDMSAHVVYHTPLYHNGRQGVDIRLLELTKIFDDQLPLMGKTLNKVCDKSYSSIVIVLHTREGSCQVIGGCTFITHS
jgi:N-acetylglutamate synthase-like GNAT family acetyltransferase